MKVLVFGPSGSGKTYVAHTLKAEGINAFDADEIEGLSNWYDRDGNKVPEPATADEALDNYYSFLWSKKAMARFLTRFEDVYVFGGSGNVASVFDLFDKIYFLQIDKQLQLDRLRSPSRPTPLMYANEDGPVIWGDWLGQLAVERNVPFVNASQTPQEIFEQISK